MIKKITINMLSKPDSIDDQGFGPAYLELIKVLNEEGKNTFVIKINKGINYDILHSHTIEPTNYLKMKMIKKRNSCFVTFFT